MQEGPFPDLKQLQVLSFKPRGPLTPRNWATEQGVSDGQVSERSFI